VASEVAVVVVDLRHRVDQQRLAFDDFPVGQPADRTRGNPHGLGTPLGRFGQEQLIDICLGCAALELAEHRHARGLVDPGNPPHVAQFDFGLDHADFAEAVVARHAGRVVAAEGLQDVRDAHVVDGNPCPGKPAFFQRTYQGPLGRRRPFAVAGFPSPSTAARVR
jgi:hypothetical protein